MSAQDFRFGSYRLEVANRRLTRDGELVEISPRYLDVLALLVREQGQLVTKNRFLEEVWTGVPVTDEALTQAIRTLRRQLGDDATTPRFIETVPKHGYRFVAEVSTTNPQPQPAPIRDTGRLTAAGTTGALLAGIVGGLIYGLAETANPQVQASGAISVLLIYVCLATLVATLGGAGVSFGMETAHRLLPSRFAANVIGGMVGGMTVGALVKLIGVDTSNLLFGYAPGDVTGAFEGVLLGAAVGLAFWLAQIRYADSVRRSGLVAALIVGATGAFIPLLGGRMLGGSLDLLATSFPNSRLHFGRIGMLFGETGFGPRTEIITGGLEGALFGACVVMALTLHRKRSAM